MKRTPQITAEAAAKLVKDGDTLLAGGFGMTGNPVNLLHALADTQTRDLTFVANNVGEHNLGGGRLLIRGQLKKLIGSFYTSNKDAVAAVKRGEVECVLMPQGSLAEAIRAGGAGIGGFYTPSSAGTLLGEGKDTRMIDGVLHVFEKAIKAQVAFIRARKADTAGNLIYEMTERNFNSAMAMCADLVIAEVDEIVPAGSLDPNHIHTPACFVDYLVQAPVQLQDLGTSASLKSSFKNEDPARVHMAKRVVQELKRGEVVNLGIGIPTLVSDYIPADQEIILQSENGMLGVGPAPADGGGAMDYPVNAGKIPVTPIPGTSYFDSTEAFAMIRGGHIDTAVIGGLQVDEQANLANWSIPNKAVLGVGGAMDLASGAGRIIVLMTHVTPDGSPKIVSTCTFPLTAVGVVDMIITDLAVFAFEAGKLVLLELMPGASLEEVEKMTQASFVNKL